MGLIHLAKGYCNFISSIALLPIIAPVKILISVWVTAKKISNCAYYYFPFKSNPYRRTPEEQARIDKLMALIVPREELVTRPAQVDSEPGPSAGPTADESFGTPLEKFRSFCKVLAVGNLVPLLEGKLPEESGEYILDQTAKVADVVTAHFGAILTNLDVSGLVDEVLAYFRTETAAHIRSDKAFYNAEKEKLEKAKQTIYDFEHGEQLRKEEIDYEAYIPTKSEKEGAERQIKEIIFNGSLLLLQDLCSEEYEKKIAEGKTPEEAHELAMAKRNATDRIWGVKAVDIPGELYEKCEERYLQWCHADTFGKEEACTQGVATLFVRSVHIEHKDTLHMDIDTHIRGLAHEIGKQAWKTARPLFERLVKKELLPSKILSSKFKKLVFLPTIESKVAKAIKKFIDPVEMEKLFAKTIYPPLVNKLFSMICEAVVKKHWETCLAQLFYAHMTHADQPEEQERFSNDIKKVVWRIMKSTNTVLQIGGKNSQIKKEQFHKIIDKIIARFQTEHFLVSKLLTLHKDNLGSLAFSFQQLINLKDQDESLSAVDTDGNYDSQPLPELIIDSDADSGSDSDFDEEFHEPVAESSAQTLRKEIGVILYNLIPKKHKKVAEREANEKDPVTRLNNFIDCLAPAIEHIEAHLRKLQEDQEEDLLTIEEIEAGILTAWDEDQPQIVRDGIGELAIDLACEFGALAPWGYWAAKGGIFNRFFTWYSGDKKGPILKMVKAYIDKTATSAIASICSTEGILEIIQSNLESAFRKKTIIEVNVEPEAVEEAGAGKVVEKVEKKTKDKEKEIEKGAVPAHQENPIESPSSSAEDLNFDRQLHLLSSVVYELIMRKAPDFTKKTVKAVAIGEDVNVLNVTLKKVHKAYFGNTLINLSRIETIVHFVFEKLNRATKESVSPIKGERVKEDEKGKEKDNK